MTHRARGFSLIELLIIVAILGILGAIGYAALPRESFAVNQAARGVAAQVNRARLEAIKQNQFAGIHFDSSDSGRYTVFVDTNDSRTFNTGDIVIFTAIFGQGDLGMVTLSADVTPILYDPRGMLHNLAAGATIIITGRSGAHTKDVVISPAGRAAIQ